MRNSRGRLWFLRGLLLGILLAAAIAVFLVKGAFSADLDRSTVLTAANSRDQPQWAAHYGELAKPLRIRIHENEDLVTLEFPAEVYGGQPWLPATAFVTFLGSSLHGDCAHNQVNGVEQDRHCIGNNEVQVTRQGRAVFSVSKRRFLEAVLDVYRIWERYETCLASQGREDVVWGGRCPPFANRTGGLERYVVTSPWKRFRIGLQWSGAGNHDAEYWLVSEDYQPMPSYPNNWDTQPEHYGELERLYSWIAAELQRPAEAVEKVPEACGCPE